MIRKSFSNNMSTGLFQSNTKDAIKRPNFQYNRYETLYTNDDDDIYRRCFKQQANEIPTSVSFLYLSLRIHIKSYFQKRKSYEWKLC